MTDFTFPLETCNRLRVQTKLQMIGDHPVWSPPREPTVDEVVAALHELSFDKRKEIGERLLGVLGLQARLQRAEDVLEALDDARLAIKRLDRYRNEYPDSGKIPF